MKLRILFCDRPKGYGHAQTKLWLSQTLPTGSYELKWCRNGEDARAACEGRDVVAFMAPMGAGVLGKFKERKLEGVVPAAKDVWRNALGAPNSFKECYGTYWKSALGCMVVGVHNPFSQEYAGRALVAQWLVGAHMLQTGKAHVRTFNYEVDPPLDRLFENENEPCAYDLETRGFSDDITHFGFADARGGVSWHWNRKVQDAVTQWMRQPRPKVAHNYVYDAPILQRVCGVALRGPLHDTIALRSALCRQWAYGLQYVTSQLFLVEPWKAYYRAGLADEAAYNAKDTQATMWNADALLGRLGLSWSDGLRGVSLL